MKAEDPPNYKAECQLEEAMNYPTPTIGTKVRVYPLHGGMVWNAVIVGFTSTGEIRVKADRPDAQTIQTISRGSRVDII
jgi:hypothetical protein